MSKKLLYFVRSLIYSIQNNYNIIFFNEKKGSSFRIQPSRLLFATLFVLFSVNFAGAQTTTLFQFNFEGTTAWTTENVTGTPTFASSGIVVNPYDTSSPCQGSSMYSARSWSVGDYYRFVVNTSGHSNLKFSFCSRTSSVSIGEFLVRVSSDSGANWTVVDDFTPTTSNLTLETGIFPESANNTGTVWIEIYKSVNGGDNGRSFIIDNATLTSYAIPTITSFTGSPVCSGSTPSVVITGTNLTGATAVNFNGLAASSFIVNSNTQITASLPSTASTGYITVTTTGGTAGSANAFVVNPPPTVTSTASPTSVISGGASTLTASVTEKTILLQEGFNGATNTWTKATTGSSGGTIANAAWTLKPAGYYYYYDNPYPGYQFTSNDNSQFYLSNSAAQGSAGNTNTQLISPPMNTTGYTSLSLEFYQFYLNFTDNTDESYVEVSTTGGAPWTIVRTNGATQGAQNNFFKTIVNLDDYINAATLYVRFRYVARFDWFWAIDNVTVSGDKTIACNYSWAATPSGTAGLPAGAATAISTNKSIVVNPTQTTNYTVTATNISTGCTATATPVQVAILAPTLTSFTPTLSCSGLNTSVVITGTNFTGASDVSFNGVSAVFTVNSNTQITATLPATATSGTISVTTAGGTVYSASSFIVNTPSLAPTGITGTTTICNGTQTILTAAGGTLGTGANYQWGTGSIVGTSPIAGQTGSTLTITPTISTTYWVRIVNTTSPCTSTTGGVTQLVTVNTPSVAPTSITGTTIICNGTQTILTATGGTLGTGANYQWGTGSVVGTSPIAGQTGSTLTITPTISTTYWVRIVNTTSPCTVATGGVTQLVTVNTPSVAPTSITGTTIICNGTQTTLTAAGGTLGTGANYQWGTGSVVGTSPIAGETGSTLTITPTSSTTYWVRIVNTTSPCTVATGGVTQLVTVNQISGDPTSASAGSASVCIGGSTTLTLNGGGGGTGETVKWYTTSCGGTPAGTGNGLSVNPTVTTTYYGRYENGTPCNYVSNCATVTVTVTALPTIPTITITQPTCTVLTGTITVTSPAPGTGFTYSIDGTTYTNTTGIFTVAENTTYNVTTQNAAGCISPVRSAVINASSDRVWNGSTDNDWTNPANWTPAIVPGNTDCVVIPTTVNKPEIAAGTSVAIHSITVDNGGLLTVRSTAILTVATSVNVATGGNLIFEDDSSLLQTSTDNTINSGHITYKRITTDVRRYDFTCWSSPIHRTPAFTLHDVSPLTLGDKYYSFNPSTGWIISYNGVLPMQQGMGYIVRAPQTYNITTPAQYEASFVGTPNNGTIEITPEANKNILVGNPYASALDAKAFINQNAVRGVDVGSLYFWTHNSPPVNSIPGDKKYYYNTADYAVFNLTGSTASSTNGNNQAPTGFIAAAASFFIKPNSSTNIVFTNSMRVGAGNDQFYKTAKADNEGKNRLWLNFANTEGAFKQALIGYLDGATNEKDYNYDGPTISGNAYVDFYSINNTDKLTIQGRALPFDDSDLVPLGYVSKIVGDFTISIDEADGFFDTQAVYLEDKNTGKITDLRAENYTFTTQKGTFDDRFVLRYTNKTLGTGDFENIDNGLLVSVKDKAIKVTSAKEAIKEVTIFDINGKLLYDKKKVSSSELLVSNLQAANQVLLVKVILENGFTTTKKVVFQ